MIKSVKVKAYLLFVSLAAAMVIGCKKDDSAIKIIPLITWENPADITFGDLLSNTQLNATANVTGTYVYIPASGTKLNVGENQELKVYFTPTDIATYDTTSKAVKINVLPAGVSSAIFNPVLTYGILTDVEGNNYKTIAIGSQIWMAENLRTTKYRNGDSIPTITGNTNWKNLTKAACCTYENTSDKDKIVTFGRLYNWFAVSDSRNIAPTGWHVATDADWLELSSFLGNENVAGGKLKETTTKHWISPNTGASNESGFTALPTGRREYTDGSFINLGYDGFWWTSSAYNPDYSWYRYLHYNVAEIFRANFHKQYGFSVRCVKD